MSEPYIGEIRMVGFTFAPRGWAFCQGQMLSIAQNQALFSLLGTTYGGNGTTTFGLPDLRGRVPVGMGTGPGMQTIEQGQMAGTQTTTLLLSNMPAHTHQATFTGTGGGAPTPPTVTIAVASTDASVSDPNGAILAKVPGSGRGTYLNQYAPASAATPGETMGGITVTPGSAGGITGGTVTLAAAGSSLPFSILNPYLGLNFIIALQGIFPSRN